MNKRNKRGITKIYVIVIAAILIAVLISAGAYYYSLRPAPPERERVLRMRIYHPIEILDPGRFTSHYTSTVMRQIYDNLVDYKVGAWPELVPELAERWDVSPDGLVYTFYLKKGVMFQKGYGEMTAADVKFTIERVMDPKLGSPYRSVWEPIISKLEILDKYTVRITLKNYDPAFLCKLAPWRPGPIVSKKAVEEFGDDYGKTAYTTVGCGAYQVVERIPKVKTVLERFEDYYGPKPYFEKVIIYEMEDESTAVLSLQKGELDICPVASKENYEIVKNDPNLNTYTVSTGSIFAVAFNEEDPILKNVLVRRALIYAVDVPAIAKSIMGELGAPAYGWLNPAYYYAGCTPDELPQYPYDPEKAKQLLAEAGYPNGFNIKFVSIAALRPHTEIPPLVQDYWRKIGVNAEIEELPVGDWFNRIYAATDPIILYTWGTRPSEPSVFLYSNFQSNSSRPGGNTMLYKGVDDLLAKMYQPMSEQERITLYKQIQKKIMEDAVILPVFFTREALSTQKYVKGVVMSPYDAWYWLENMYFEG